jgi:predicted CoA-binding protein
MPWSRLRFYRREVPVEKSDPIQDLLEEAETIAVVGCSPKPERASHRVAAYLQRVGYTVIPVNPGVDEILGVRCYPNLMAIPEEISVDIVDVFRRSEFVPPIAQAAIDRGARALWLQLDITHPKAERAAEKAGLTVVSNKCIKIERAARIGKP